MRSSSPEHWWLRLTASCRDHHTNSTGLLSGDHEGRGCKRMRPADSCTYSLTRLLRWLESLSVARCSSLWQRYVLLSLSSSLQLQRSWRAQPAMFDGRVLFEQLLDALVRLLPEQRSRAARPAVVEGGAPFPSEAGYDRIHGGARAEEHASDLGGRASIGGEQRDVHPQPAAGLRFALHLDDEVFAYLRCDGDILHVRPFLRWLDGCGVFTMPQRTAACLIILCFYLAPIVGLRRDQARPRRLHRGPAQGGAPQPHPCHALRAWFNQVRTQLPR